MPQKNVPSFAEMLADCQQSAVHLELRDAYGIAAEAAEFAAWQRGDDSSRHDREGRRKAWLDLVREATGRGVTMRRVRVVSEPLSEYMRFSHAGAHLNVEAGEDIRWLPRRLASDIPFPGNCFWAFDNRVVRFNHFTGEGASAGPEIRAEPHVVKLCATAFQESWGRAVPHENYEV